MSQHSTSHPSGYDTDAEKASKTVRTLATVVGAVFLVVGILGFIPGITTNIYPIDFAGHDANAQLLGIFEVSILHNVVHLLFGLVGVISAATFRASRGYLIGGGVVYLVVWLYGIIVGHEDAANFVPVNTADNWLHLGLAAGMILLGLILGRRDTKTRP